MWIYKALGTVSSLLVLLILPLSIVAQENVRPGSRTQQTDYLLSGEITKSEEFQRFIHEYSFSNPSFRAKQTPSIEESTAVQGSKQVRMIYLVPSDRTVRADYQNAIANAISDLQKFFKQQIGGSTFSIHSPIVEVHQTAHTAAFYSSDSSTHGFAQKVLMDGFALTGGGFQDPNNRWIFYVDADPACGQIIGGGGGIAILGANDLRGLTGQPNVPACSGDPPDLGGVGRWIGGLGHELGHSFDLPHPPGCDQSNCTGGQFAANSLMWVGYAAYPNTYLLDADKTQLLATGFFSNLALDPLAFYSISGHVRNNDGTPINGASVMISNIEMTVVSAMDGSFSFSNLPAGGNFTISVAKAGLTFAPTAVFFNNLDRNQVVSFKVAPKISGKVTVNDIGLPGVTVFIVGSQSGTALTDANGNYSFNNLSVGGSYGVIPAKSNYTFTPQQQTFNQLSNDQIANFSARLNSGIPILISEEHSTRALALDSVLRRREPFQQTYDYPWSIDRRARIMFFATNFELLSNETALAVTADAEDASHNRWILPVEYVGKVPGFDWLTCVIVRWDVGAAGDVLVQIRYRGNASNRVRVGAVHVGGGLPDDADALPTPGRPPQ